MGDLELPSKAEMLWPVGSAHHWREGNSMAPWLSHLPTLAKAVGAVQLCFSSQWITSTLYSPGRFDDAFWRVCFFVAYIESASNYLKKQKFSQISLYKEGWFVMFIIFLLCFCQLSSLLGTPSPFGFEPVRKFRIWTFIALPPKLGRHTASCLVVKSMGSINNLYKLLLLCQVSYSIWIGYVVIGYYIFIYIYIFIWLYI